jgi:4-amino-4-deoxy-L-arabinose transferase-like glycosyltransferase
VLLPPEAEPYKAFVADFPYNAEVIQPPLYHLALAPLYSVISGSLFAKLFAIRLVSLALGTLVVIASYALAAEVLPEDLAIRAGTPIFVALHPQFSFEAAIVNHDILVILLATLLMWLLLAWSARGYDTRRKVWLGILTGVGMLTKTSFGLMLPVVVLAILFENRRYSHSTRRFVRDAALPCAVALVIFSPWLVRSLLLYGDPTGAQELRSIPDYGEQAMSVPDMLTSSVFWRERLEDFWGNYGWRLIPFDPDTYRAIYVVWGVSATGLMLLAVKGVVSAARRRTWSPWASRQWSGLTLVAVWVLLMIAGVVYVGTIQFTQSRFAFPAIAGFALLTSVGYAQLAPRRFEWLIPPLMLALLVTLNVVTAIQFLLPFYAGSGGRPGVTP